MIPEIKRTVAGVLLALGISGLGLSISHAEESAPGTGDAVMSGSPHVNLRYRFEHVEQDDFDENANASTLRIRLNYGTEKWRGWSGFAEFDYIAEVLVNDFNSGAGTSPPDRDQYPLVADPKGADLNQLYLDYEGFDKTRLRFGRQKILLDNERFVGPVGWRQNEQTFDGVSATLNGLPKTELFYSYIARVNRVFGERSFAGQQDMNTHLLNGRIGVTDKWQLTPYAYFIDNDDAPEFSTSTLGVRANGEVGLAGGAVKLLAEFATQSDAANNPVSYRAQYIHLRADWAMHNGLTLGLAVEGLGGDQNDPGKAFRTPLATLHPFQGWADQFLITPNAGIQDVYASVKYKLNKWTLLGVYHDFSAADGGARWGSEIDLAASRAMGERYSILLKAAFFRADDASFVDTNKIWVQLVANY